MYKEMLADEVEFRKFSQYLFFNQWGSVKDYANRNGIKIIGDIPIFIAFDSSDAWANPELFEFDEERKPVKVAGVPPDYFSSTGQLWGNPIYDWEKMKNNGFKWWIERIKANLKISDIIRIDHFRGFAQYWGIPYGETTAIKGEWYDSPGIELFEAIRNSLGKLPIIAEDLGTITPDVIELRERFAFPGMKILQFAFDPEDEESHFPCDYDKNLVVYTGTHDNNTVVGWYSAANNRDRTHAKEYLNIPHNRNDVEWNFIRSAWASVADIAIAPIQDLLGLDESARMNTPSTASGNWQWRYKKGTLNKRLAEKLKKITNLYYR
jgi:4-alpha-glucanotransferase